jgi:hypothetical protein
MEDDREWLYKLSQYSSEVVTRSMPYGELAAESYAAYMMGDTQVVHPAFLELFGSME